jgi:exopolyphosphatase / guanosine-5'-triphosphate,3'-diphosphate pyrophosphatase
MRLAAIDIGSNASRLLISEVSIHNKETRFQKLNLVRVPLRLGFDVFETGKILPARQEMLINTLLSYKYLLQAYEVQHVKTAATSAMRDASNAAEVIAKVAAATGITINIISGDVEANYIYKNYFNSNSIKNQCYMGIDVGGGSTELTFYDNAIIRWKKSFNIGTIRLLKNKVLDSHWDAMRECIKKETKNTSNPIVAIGSGGNINKIFSISKRKEGKPLSLELLKDYYKEFSSVTVQERMHLYNLREDRADVLVPALQIYTSVMRWAGIEEIVVPKIGLADGLTAHLYEEMAFAH